MMNPCCDSVLVGNRWNRRRPVPELNTKFLRNPEAQFLELLEILPGCAVPEHALLVTLNLIVTVHPIKAGYYGVASRQGVQDAVIRENSRIKYV